MNLKAISRLLCGCAWGISLLPGQVNAQAVASDAGAVIDQASEEGHGDEIIVTARQKNESLKDVPASVYVLSTDTIENTKARVAVDFVSLTSGVTIQTATTDPSDVSINIRGLNSPRDAENNIALVVDGVLKTSIASTNEPQGALAQVEILKGPQGAIYGRNASAGAIVITTKKPTPDLSGQIKGRVANDNTYLVSGLLSGPLTDGVGFVLNGEWTKSDGYYRNTFVGTDLHQSVYGYRGNPASVDSYNKLNIFGRILIEPSDDTEIDLKANYGRSHGGALSFNAVFQIPTLAQAFNDPIFNAPVSKHKFIFTDDTEAKHWQKTYGASMRIRQDLDFGTLIGVVAYNNNRNEYIAGGTSGAFGFFNNEPTCIRTRPATAGVVNQAPFTQYNAAFGFAMPYSPSTCDGIQGNRRTQKDVVSEIRLTGGEGTSLNWQLGGSYIYIDRRVCVNLTLDTGQGGTRQCFTTDPRFPTENLTDDNYRTNVYAVFAAADWDATDKLRLGVALRYDIEARDRFNNVPVNARTRWVGNPRTGYPIGTATTPSNYFLNPGLDPAYNPSGVIAPISETFKQLQPKITITYKPNSDLTIFGNWGMGFKAGGFNPAGTEAIINGYFNPPPPTGISAGISVPDLIKKETNSAFELGVKGRVFDAVNFEVAGFLTNVKNMQFFEFFVGDFGLLRSTSNIDKVQIYGVDASIDYKISPVFKVFVNGNYTQSEIKANSGRPYTVGNKSPATPDFTINGGVQMNAPVSDRVNLVSRIDFRVVGPTPFHTVQRNTTPTIFGLPATYDNSTRDTFATVNARLGVDVGNFSISAFATNLFNKQYVEDVVIAPEFGGDFIAGGALRRFGVDVSYKF
ncbi:TonB-dependent receptor [Sphingopyxis sp. P1IMeth2]|uniref:TonB-dependent receptor n=1 Tax=Sphingopyxis sp. P1IMeth2 TaxID=1892848 RepID=UPI001645AAB1|nr:TonB-dependent receptor [Sphingopyxis sp. P1IMeth2]